jgi:hypothetical protein
VIFNGRVVNFRVASRGVILNSVVSDLLFQFLIFYVVLLVDYEGNVIFAVHIGNRDHASSVRGARETCAGLQHRGRGSISHIPRDQWASMLRRITCFNDNSRYSHELRVDLHTSS